MANDKPKHRGSNRNPDPVISLNRQFNKLMQGKHSNRIKDRKVNGKWNITKDRYEAGGMIYQMQVDYCYLIRDVKDSKGKNPGAIRRCQEFINSFKAKLTAPSE